MIRCCCAITVGAVLGIVVLAIGAFIASEMCDLNIAEW